jgi:outer membrane lipoprotein-sorting protein
MSRPMTILDFKRLGRQTAVAAAFLVVAAAGALSAPPAVAPPALPSPQTLYQASLLADARYSYEGRQVTTYWRTGRTVAVEVTHQAPDWVRMDYLSPTRLSGIVVLNDGRRQWVYDPITKTLRHHELPVRSASSQNATRAYQLLKRNYLLSLPLAKTVAGRNAYVLDFRRKASGVSAERLWIDSATGLLLRTERYGESGAPTVTVAYTAINYHPALTAGTFTVPGMRGEPGILIRPEAATKEQAIPLAAVGAQLGSHAEAPQVVAGYKLVGAGTTAVSGRPVLHLRYSDGLNMVSVFERLKRQANRPTRVPRAMRPVQIGGVQAHQARRASLVMVNWDNRDLNLTLMGEIGAPAVTGFVTAFSSE